MTAHRYDVDAIATVQEYLDRSDWRVNANANQGYSLGGLVLNSAGKIVANYWLEHVYTPEIGAPHREGDYHIHDLDMFAGYCAGWSLKRLIQEGFNGVGGAIASAPPKHFSSACGQIVNFLGTLQNEWAGAQAFSSFDTYMAPFVRLDNMEYEEVVQCMQELIYNLNVPSRWGSQCPFTNLTFDWTCPDLSLIHISPMVSLVDDDEAQRRQETRPPRVRRKHHVVQEIGVRQDQVRARTRPLLRLAGRVPVHGRRAHTTQALIDEAWASFRVRARLCVGRLVVLAEQRHERGQLIRRQSLRRSQVQGRRATVNRGNT